MPLNISVLRDAGPYARTPDIQERERSLVQAVHLLLGTPDVDSRHRRQLIDIAIWKYTEASGLFPYPKYNLRFVSQGARNLEVEASVNHEHVWPRRWILDKLFAKRSWSLEELTAFLREHAVACVVTIEEHALLGNARPPGWKRYAEAGVRVWDRQEQAYLDVAAKEPTAAGRLDSAPPPSPVERFDLDELIEQRGERLAPYLRKLKRMARFGSAVSVVAVKTNGEPSDYFRIHDALLEEPTGAVAYAHWSGKVDFALTPQDVPQAIVEDNSVRTLRGKKHAVSSKVTDEQTLEIAEELLFLALEKLRTTNGSPSE